MENQELKLIKKTYGEEMMHLCRDLFPTLLEQPNLVYSILEKNIAPTKSLATDIIENVLEAEFKNYIYSFIATEQKQIKTVKTPSELLKEKGYILYECNTEKEIQKFKKYYSKGEELCTFRNNRLKRCHVFFAVKENVKEIKREDFTNPDRQDLYGTSVISIQFSKDKNNTLSIKNRYNHTVKNPDATFSNNLENIIPGLTNSFEKYYGLNINQETNNYSSFLTDELNYVRCNDKYYRYNYEMNNIYYCENNIIIDNGRLIDKYSKEKERYIIFDYFIIDMKDKTISLYDITIGEESFIDSINEIGKIKNIMISKDKIVTIEYENKKQISIGLNKNNCMVTYKNDHVKIIKHSFLLYSKYLIKIELSNVQTIEHRFLSSNSRILNIELPNVENIGDNFVINNTELLNLELPKVKNIGSDFLRFNKKLINVSMPEVKNIGSRFLLHNEALESINLESVENIKNDFLEYNNKLKKIKLLNIQTIGDNFLSSNEVLKNIKIPQIKIIGEDFLESSEKQQKILTKIKKKNYNAKIY